MRGVINQIQIFSIVVSNVKTPCRSLVQVLKGTVFMSSCSDMLVWFQKGNLCYVVNDKSSQSDGLKTQEFPVPVWDFDFPQ